MVCSSLVVRKSKRQESALLFSNIRRSGEKPKRMDALVASILPKRLIDQEFGVCPGDPDVAEHPVVEPGEISSVSGAPSPLPQCREEPAHESTRRPPLPVMRDYAEPATRYLEMDRRHLNSPNVV
jgi:hypothetical protein